jgi:hypothetical protein
MDFDNWYNMNKGALKHLYFNLIETSNTYGIQIIENQKSINNFIVMMYNESNGETINKKVFPEYFNIKYNNNGYQEYKILNKKIID